MYSRHQSIFKASEINKPGGGVITKLSWYRTTNFAETNSVGSTEIWLTETTIEAFPPTPVSWYAPGTLVKTISSIDFSATSGWYEIDIDDYVYGGGNLMVSVRTQGTTVLGSTNRFSGTQYLGTDLPSMQGVHATNNLPPLGRHSVRPDIQLEFKEETLPIVLSSFTATINVQNFVNLMWITQSETGVSGYYVYRNTENEISQAALISPLIVATNTSLQQSYTFTDNQLYDEGVYYYWLQNVDFDGSNNFHGPVMVNYSTTSHETPAIPQVTELKGIFPNPFNPTAQISYSIKDAATVNIRIYNSRGQIVRSYNNAPGTVGNHRIVWDGRDDIGSGCSTGLYFVRMYAGKNVFTQKAMLVK